MSPLCDAIKAPLFPINCVFMCVHIYLYACTCRAKIHFHISLLLKNNNFHVNFFLLPFFSFLQFFHLNYNYTYADMAATLLLSLFLLFLSFHRKCDVVEGAKASNFNNQIQLKWIMCHIYIKMPCVCGRVVDVVAAFADVVAGEMKEEDIHNF